MSVMKTYISAVILLIVCVFATECNVLAEPIARITGDVATEFGTYQPVLIDVVPAVNPYTINEDFSNVVNFNNFDLNTEAEALLLENGFACTASCYRQVYDIYNECEDRGIPAFVTSDACLHTYHILYDNMLRILEVQYFYNDLDKLTIALIEHIQTSYESATDSTVKEAALEAKAYLYVALSLLLGSSDMVDEDVKNRVDEEIAQIYALSDGYIYSPLLYRDDYPYREDYSQYKPRGHYTRTPELERYFRAMMWLGRITFSLTLPYATQEGTRCTTRQALLISRALALSNVEDKSAAHVWENIYQPTVFFVGKSDDITFDLYLGIAKEVFGDDFLSQSVDVLAEDADIDSFISRALELPDPEITVTAGKGLRVMGQRYIPDSYMLDQLVFMNVDRFMPRGLDVMAVLGSERAYEILDTVYHDTQYLNYIEQMEMLKAKFAGYASEIWAQNLYYNWLYTLIPLLEIKGAGYPVFMQNQPWIDKNLNTTLGSWAELRHDSILYAKQSETYIIGVPPEPPYVMGYVEPEPEVYGRLAALADFMERGLDERGLLDSDIGDRLEQFENCMLALTDIAVKELTNITPTPQEFALIANFGGIIESLNTFPGETIFQSKADDYMAVIADVHTDPNSNTALEVGVGHPLKIYVIAPVSGIPTMTVGGIFSYHEFTQSLADGRLTDEEWQLFQSGPDAKPMPVWTESFIAGESSMNDETFHYDANERTVIAAIDDNSLPLSFELRQNYPNPFNPTTSIPFTLPEPGNVTIDIYNINGQKVDTLINRYLEAGRHTVYWDGAC